MKTKMGYHMKRFLTGLLAACVAFSASGATLNPIQLLSPAGSTSGQSITSTGPSSPPAWSNVGNGVPNYGVTQYGALCNGTTNDAPAIQNAINAAQTAGGGLIVFPPGKTCDISSTLNITANNVILDCPSGSNNPNTNGPFIFGTSGCALKWTGAAAGAMVGIVAPSGSTSDLPLQGDGAIGMTFNGNGGLAGDGLFMQTLDAGLFLNDAFYNFSGSTTIELGTITVTNSNFNTQATADSQWNLFDGIYIQNYIGAGGVTASPSSGMTFDAYAGGGALTVNASLNTVRNVDMGLGAGATGIVMKGDTNRFYNIVISAFASTAPSVDFQIQQNGAQYFTGSSNDFHGFVANNAVLARGQTSYPGCTSAFAAYTSFTCTNGDTFDGVDDGNGTPAPTIEPGAQVMWRTQNGSSVGQVFGPIAMGENQTDSLGAGGAIASTTTLQVRNSGGDHIRLDNAGGTVTWGITFDGSNDLEFVPHAGASGAVSFAGGAIIPNTTSGIRGTTLGDSANVGSVGEIISNSTAGVSLPNNTITTAASISLTAGDWDVTGAVTFVPAGGTTNTGHTVGISTNPAAYPTANTGGFMAYNYSDPTGFGSTLPTPTTRLNLTATTTVYLVTQAPFSGGTETVSGFIRARRVR
jgi:hypothetical protein